MGNYIFFNIMLAAIVYMVGGILGVQLAIPPGYATAIFPASGIALAIVLYGGRAFLPSVWLGSFLLNNYIGFSQHQELSLFTVVISAIIAMGSMVQAFVGAEVIKKLLGINSLKLSRDLDILKFLIIGGPIVCVVSATVGTLTLWSSGGLLSNQILFNWWNWYVGDTIGVLLFAPLTLAFLHRHDVLWHSRIKFVVIPTIILSLAIVSVFFYISQSEMARLKGLVTEQGKTMSNSIQNEIVGYSESVNALKGFVGVNQTLTLDEFNKFAASDFPNHPYLHALSWNPYVLDSERQGFELELAKIRGVAQYKIVEKDIDGKIVPAKVRDNYVVVKYIYPYKGNEIAIGYDISSNKVRADAISATMINKTGMTAPIRLVQETGSGQGILILTPVYADDNKESLRKGLVNTKSDKGFSKMTEDKESSLLGYAVGVFRIEKLLSALLLSMLPKGMELSLVDVGVDGADGVLYDTRAKSNTLKPIFEWATDIKMAGRIWRLTLYPNSGYLEDNRTLAPWVILFVGLLLSSFLQAILLSITGRNAAIQEIVDEKTDLLRRELSAREISEKKVSAAEKYARSLIEASIDPLVTIDANGMITDVNIATEKITGFSRAELIGKDFSNYFTDPVKARASYKEVFDKGYVTDYPLAIRGSNGQITEVLYNASVYRDEAGVVLGVFAAARDITEQRKVEKIIQDARVSAENLAQSKASFLANMSHEIRTPMNGIIGLSQLALNQEMSPVLRDYLGKISNSSQSLLGILNDILDFSKLESGKVKLESIKFDLDTLTSTLRDLFEDKAHAKNIDLFINVGIDVPRVLIGDPLRLQQVLSNLISNAIKFTDEGWVKLTISSAAQSNSNSNSPQLSEKTVILHIDVSDTGIGMDAKTISELFTVFNQADNSITRRYGGTGLGLAISKQLLNLMSSDFSIKSQLGLGTTFNFDIALGIVSEEVFQSKTSQSITEAGYLENRLKMSANTLKGVRVLVAEDNKINQQVVREFLKMSGLDVVIAENGQIAIDLLGEQDFDIILMDLHMPVLGGVDATKEIRSNINKLSVNKCNIPIIALTADVVEEERQNCLDIGMNDFVTKPINPEVLINTIIKHIRHK